MSISLKKDQKINLSKEAPGAQKFIIGLGWDPNASGGSNFDLDASAFLCIHDENGNPRLADDPGFIFYGNLESPDGGVVHTADNLTGGGDGDDEQIIIDFSKLDPKYVEIPIVVSIYQAHLRKQYFGMVKNAYIRIVDASNNQEVARYDLTEDFSMETLAHFGSLYKKDGEWRFSAVGAGFQADPSQGRTGELDDFVKFYGGHLAAA